MAAFSSRGFTLPDHRIKPDVVAPGTSILSTRSSKALLFDEDDNRWCYMSGTSMATPIVAGCCAVIRGALVDNDTPDPSAALIKAILINGAVQLKGQYKDVNPNEAQDYGPFPPRHYQDFGIEYYQEFGVFANTPNPNFGFGRVNLDNSLQHVHKYDESTYLRDGDSIKVGFFHLEDSRGFRDLPGRRAGFFELAGGKALGKDGIHRSKFQFFVHTPTDETPNLTLKVTLAWNDPPGEVLQNDLDLVVRIRRGDVDVEERHGNMYAGDPRFDRVNNVEQVVWRDVGCQKVYEVEIKAYNMTKNPQPCAVAWYLYQDDDLGKYMESVRREALARLERGKTMSGNFLG